MDENTTDGKAKSEPRETKQAIITETDWEDRLWKLKYNSVLATKYHIERQAFYIKIYKWISGVSVFLSTAAAASLTNNLENVWKITLPAVVAVLQTLDLIIDTRKQSQTHEQFRREYLKLSKEISEANSKLNNGTLTELELQRLEAILFKIESSEPPIYKKLLEFAAIETNRYLEVEAEAELKQKQKQKQKQKLSQLGFFDNLLKNIWR